MAKIFISYSRDSQDIVEELVQDLHDDGHETWFDQRLTGGRKWWDMILSEIRTCDIFVAALTPDFLESQACRRELNYAGLLQKPLCPVRLSDKVQPEALAHGLAELQCVDYCRRDKPALKMLQRTIRELPKAPTLPDPLPDPPAVPISYLNSLRERIETDSPLEFKDQAQLVFELRCSFRDGGPAEEITDLLQRLKKRDELFAKVARDIDELLGDISRGQRGSPWNNERTVSNDTPEEARKDQVPEAGPDNGTERELTLDSAVAECSRLMERVLNKGECWVFEIDSQNRFFIRLDASAATPSIRANACLVDIDNTKLRALKALGWKVKPGLAAAAGDNVAVAVDFGIAAAAWLISMSRRGRDLRNKLKDNFNKLEANRSWMVISPKDTLLLAASDLTRALRSVASEAKTIIVSRQGADRPQLPQFPVRIRISAFLILLSFIVLELGLWKLLRH